MTYKISYQIHPNNESRLTLWKERQKRVSIAEQAQAFLGECPVELLTTRRADSENSSPLTFVPNSEPTIIRCQAHEYNRTDFGLNAARRIMRAAGAMDRNDTEIGNYLFLTATLPGDTEEAKWAIANYSHILIDRLKSWLSKRISNRKEFYVWEHQERGALHFHYCIYVPDETIKLSIEKRFKRQWTRLLDGITEEFGVNLWGKWASKPLRYRVAILQARVERVYKSVGAYMAGYLSGKGSKHSDDRKHYWYPKRWFGVSRPLSELVKKHTDEKIDEFTSRKEAEEYWCKKEQELLNDVLTHAPYPHKVGEGKTHVFYHTPEKQAELWQENKMLNHNPHQHPNIAAMIEVVLKATSDGQRLAARSRKYRELLSPKSFGYFEDSTFLISLRRGAVSQKHLKALMDAFTACDFASDSPYLTSSFSDSLRRANNLIGAYREQFRWNQYGWLNNDRDFDRPVDISRYGVYARTSGENRTQGEAEIDSHGHVPSESVCLPSPSPNLPLQLSWLP